MSEPQTPTTQAVSHLRATGHSPAPAGGQPVVSSAASHRATRGLATGNANAAAPQSDGFVASEDTFTPSNGTGSMVDGLVSWFGNVAQQAGTTYKQATTRFNLTDDEKKQLKHGISTLEKLAGEDRRWNSNDLADNMQQLQVRPILKPIAESQMRKGMEEMTGQPVPKLTTEQKSQAGERWSQLGEEQRDARKVDRGEMDRFRDTMDMIRNRGAELGFPDGKFPNGLSVDFLQAVMENQPGIMLNFKR